MEHWKFLVDVLSASASFVAVVTVCVGWGLSARKPIFIERVAMLPTGQDSFQVAIFIVNRKSFPVTINTMHCFSEKQYRVEKEFGQRPVKTSSLSLNDRLFDGPVPMLVQAQGVQRFLLNVPRNLQRPKQIHFSMDTTHGYVNYTCKKITHSADMARVIGADFIYVSRSKFGVVGLYCLAWVYWVLLKIKVVPERIARKIVPRNKYKV